MSEFLLLIWNELFFTRSSGSIPEFLLYKHGSVTTAFEVFVFFISSVVMLNE